MQRRGQPLGHPTHLRRRVSSATDPHLPRADRPIHSSLPSTTRLHHRQHMSALQFIVQGGQKLSGTIRPSGNKNAALPIICAALLTEHPVTLNNVPRIRDVETLVELIASAGVDVNWIERNTLRIHAQTVRSTKLDPNLCRKIRASILLARPLLARCGPIQLPPPA